MLMAGRKEPVEYANMECELGIHLKTFHSHHLSMTEYANITPTSRTTVTSSAMRRLCEFDSGIRTLYFHRKPTSDLLEMR